MAQSWRQRKSRHNHAEHAVLYLLAEAGKSLPKELAVFVRQHRAVPPLLLVCRPNPSGFSTPGVDSARRREKPHPIADSDLVGIVYLAVGAARHNLEEVSV